jgi:hypothetical protein
MQIGGVEVKRRVWAGLAGALAVTAAWVLWSQATLTALGAAPKPPEGFVRLTGRGDAAVERMLRERAAFQDATPLFFPTAANYRPANQAGALETGQMFRDFEAVLKYQESVPRFAAEAVTPPETAVELLEKGSEAPFAGFGQADARYSTMQNRWARAEAKSLLDGRLALTVDIGAAGSPEPEFGVMEFVVKVGPAGLEGQPLLTASSGRPEVDSFARDYLVKIARIGARLPPGSYRVLVGP